MLGKAQAHLKGQLGCGECLYARLALCGLDEV